MEILYISSACKKENKDLIDSTSRIKLQMSGIKFHNLLIEGLANNNCNVESLIGLPISINTNKKKIWYKKINIDNNITYNQVGFINIPILKQLTTAINIFVNIFIWIKKNQKKDKAIIIDMTYVTIIPYIGILKSLFKQKVFGIMADVYDYMFDVENYNGKNKLISKVSRKLINKNYNKLDGYIFLTDYMKELIDYKNKKYIVIEGLVDKINNTNNNKNKINPKVILYSGGLYEKFGVKLLLDAFIEIKDDSLQLWLYGAGDLIEIINKYKLIDNRIHFFGMVPNQEVVNSQITATLLVNPRPTKDEFTKYSFPSKVIEYMVSGTPVLTTKLSGIPEEYYKYVYTIEDESIKGLKKDIEKIISLTSEELNLKGNAAKKFVLTEKNNLIQAKKIINLINKIELI